MSKENVIDQNTAFGIVEIVGDVTDKKVLPARLIGEEVGFVSGFQTLQIDF